MANIIFIRREFEKILKYGVSGILTNVILYLLFILLLRTGISPVLASVISFLIGVIISYTLNRNWTFSSKSNHVKDTTKFITAQGIGLLFTVIIISSLILYIPAEFAQIINVGITAPIIYVSLRVLKFGENK